MYKLGQCFLVLFVLGIPASYAQKQVDHQSLYWLRYYTTLIFTPHWNWQTELDTRHFFVNSRQQQFIAHTRVAYKPNDIWYFSAGLTGSWQKSQDPYLYPRPVTPELRLVQEASLNQPLHSSLGLNYRIRTEERFVSNHTGHFDTDYRFGFRHRYRVQMTYTFDQLNITLRGSEELFVNANQRNFFAALDQNRGYLSVEKRFNPALAVELGYMNIRQSFPGKGLLVKRDNVRLTLYHTLFLH